MIQFLANLIGVDEKVIQHVLLPFTYCPQSKKLMADVRSYVIDYRIVENVYSLNFNNSILMFDLVTFCFCKTIGFTQHQTHLVYSIPAINRQMRNGYFAKMSVKKCSRISRTLWGVLTREQRTQFINKYILPDDKDV